MKVFYFFYPENMSYPKLSHKKYQEKWFERDIVLDNVLTLMFPLFQAQEMCLRPIAK